MTPAQAKIKEWRLNPLRFVVEHLRVQPDRWQETTLKHIEDPAVMQVAMQACVGPGKTALLAWLMWWFMVCFCEKGEHPKGAAVSITWDNLQANLWAEIAKWQGRSKFLMETFSWTAKRVFAKDHPETWFFSARAWRQSATPEQLGTALSGLHAKFVLCLMDEAGGTPVPILRSAKQALTNCKWGLIAMAGNPTSHEGALYHAVKTEAAEWRVVRITGDPDDPDHSPRVNLEFNRKQIETYGRDNPWVMAHILGKFPPASINTLLGPDEVRDSMGRQLLEEQYIYSQKRMGIDVARFGDDRTVLFPRQGLAAMQPAEMRNATGPEIAARVQLAMSRWSPEMITVDDTGGYGASAIDAMDLAGIPNIPVNSSGKAANPRYYNRRAEMYFSMAEWIKKGGALPNIPGLISELTAPTYTMKDGKMLLEPKDKIKERIGRSPDFADALALTFAIVDLPAKAPHPGLEVSTHVTDYDPLA